MSGIMDNNGIVDKVNDFQAKEILEDSFDMNNIAKLNSARVCYFSFGYNYEQNKVMSDISGKIKPYLIRIDSVKNIHDIGCENLQNELEKLNKQKRDISKKTLSYILERGNDLKFDDIISSINFQLVIFSSANCLKNNSSFTLSLPPTNNCSNKSKL